MKWHIMIIGLILVITRSYGQQKQKTLSVGEYIRDIMITNALGGDKDIRLLDGKALVLDFGSTTCGPCMASLEKFEILKKKFPGQLQVISVTGDKQQRVDSYLRGAGRGKVQTIPIVYEDSLLKNMFPHLTTPHLVWISKEGKILAFTSNDYVKEEYVKDFLEAQDIISWPVKWDFQLDDTQPLQIWNSKLNLGDNVAAGKQSILLCGYISTTYSLFKSLRDSSTHMIRYLAINQPVAEMYLQLYGKSLRRNFKGYQVIAENFDGKGLVYDVSSGTKAEWQKDHAYCYEMYFADSLSNTQVNRNINLYLEQYFSIGARIADIRREVWYITSSKDNPKSKKGDIFGLTMKELIAKKNQIQGTAPLEFNNSHLDAQRDFMVKMDIDVSLIHDFQYLKDKLQLYGYTLKKGEKMIESLIMYKL